MKWIKFAMLAAGLAACLFLPLTSATHAQGKSFWESNPPVRIFPRMGFFTIPPAGEGYYSLLDVLTGEERQNPPKTPFPRFALMPPSFFDLDFRYLDNPRNQEENLFDPLHRIHIGDDWLFATGGQAWIRYMNEANSRLKGKQNVYELTRARLFGDLWFRDLFRVYVEYLDAQSFGENLAPLVIDENHSDLLNAFFDVRLAEIDDKGVYLRVGRQELLLGSQRLISTLDWANTRRTFQGVRAFRQGEKFDVDLFWVQPVIPNPGHFDSVDNNQNFAGAWFTYRPKKGQFVDMYYLFLDNVTPTKLAGEVGAVPTNVHTMGTRCAGDKNNVLWDVELMFQLGSRGSQNLIAGAATAGAGYHFADVPTDPNVWLYYDYASGDRNPGKGSTFTTFNQLFPFGHNYMGWLDLVGRQNIHDVNCHLFFYPARWITCWTQFHTFYLAEATDALYSPGGAILRQDVTGAAGRNVGQEIDFICNVTLTPTSNVQAGYCHLFPGGFISGTGSAINPSLFYAMYNLRW